MRMSSTVKKGKSQPSNSAALPLSKDGSAVKTTNSKAGEAKNSDSSKDQLNPKLQPTAEQLRIAQMISDSKRDDPELPDKVNKLVELTNCSSDAAIIALHDSNNDLDQAIVALLDGDAEDVWEVSGKKKKTKQLTQQSGSSEDIGMTNNGNGASGGGGRGRDRERSRSSRGGPPRLRAGRGRGGRDNKENVEENENGAADASSSRGRGSRSGPRMSNGPGRGSAGRGGRGGGSGGLRRGGAPRSDANWDDGLTNVEPWRGPPEATGTNSEFPSADDWDNEEYIGSLVETKVFTPSSSTVVAQAPNVEQASLTNGSVMPLEQQQAAPQPPPPQVHYSSGAAGQGIDLNALLQKTSGVTLAGSSSLQQQFLGHHYSSQQQATDALKAAMGVGSKSVKPLRSKIPPPSKIPSSAVEMPDDSSISGLDVKFGTLDFGIGQSGFDMSGLDMSMMPTSSASSGMSNKQSDQQHNNHHSLMSSSAKMDQYGTVQQQQQPPAPSSLPKPDASLGGFSSTGSSVSSAQSMSSNNAPSSQQVKAANSAYSAYGASSYAPPGVSSSQAASSGSQPAGAYPSTTSGVYSSGTTSSVYQGSQNSAYGSYAQQQQQQQQQPSANYQAYNNNKMNSEAQNSSVSSSSLGLQGSAASRSGAVAASAAAKPGVAATQVGSSQAVPNLPPGVPTMLGPGGFIMGQAPGLPYYAAAAGIQQHPVYSLEDMQYRYPHLAAGYYDMGYGQSPTSLGTGREGTLASLAYATGSDAKFSRNENNSPVPTSLSQNAAQSHGGAFITPAAAAPTPLTPAYAYYYSGGVMPGSYQFGAPAALYPVSAAASGHAGGAGNPVNQYGKTGGPLSGTGASGTAGSQSGGQTGQVASSGGNAGSAGVVTGQSNAAGATSGGGYASYGSTYDEFSKSVYGSVSAGGQATKMGGGSGGPSSGTAGSGADMSYGKTQHQLGKINTYDKTGGFHTGTPPPYGLAGNASGAPLGVGVGGPSPYGGQHMFIPTLAPHQSQHSHLMHQQLHQDSNSGPGQRSQGGGQQNKQGSKPSYGGSYWGSN